MATKTPGKKRLREEILARRDALDAGQRARSSRDAWTHLTALPFWPGRGAVLFFHTMKTEVETPPMIEEAVRQGIAAALPRMEPEGRLSLFRISDLSQDLEVNSIGILEPRQSCPRVETEDLSIVIVPGVAFDPLGYRIGYGGGFYDRLLSENPRPWRVALAFDLQRVPRVPRKPHDVPVDVLVTEKGARFYYRRPGLGPDPSPQTQSIGM